MMWKKPIVFCIIVILGLAGVYVYAQLPYILRISNTATIRTIGVEVYWDENCTDSVSFINLGKLSPGENKTVPIFVRSTSNIDVTLSLTDGYWDPENASEYINLTWNYKNTTIVTPTQVLPVDLCLHVADEITGIESFSFDIIITAIEVGQ